LLLISVAAEIAEELARLKGEEEEAQRQFDREQAEKRGQQIEEENNEGGEQRGMGEQDVGVRTEDDDEEEEEEEEHVVSCLLNVYKRSSGNIEIFYK